VRSVWILVGILVGVVLGLLVGFTLVQVVVGLHGLDETEMLALALFGGLGGPVAGAITGGVVAARMTRS
jgi:hypothetical protein